MEFVTVHVVGREDGPRQVRHFLRYCELRQTARGSTGKLLSCGAPSTEQATPLQARETHETRLEGMTLPPTRSPFCEPFMVAP